ncbi:MAG TPA: DUF3015 domain-containing protein [Gammaproteobacteria bacterium]|jgi:hypothetical protein
MDKKIIMAVGLLLISGSVMADSGPGCGWGAMVFEGKDGTVSHVLAATTNGTFGNQTFGMTSGTAGCNTSTKISTAALNQFLDSNIDKVAFDMSRGSGEALESLANLLDIAAEDKTTFFNATKANFDRIFSKVDVTREAVVNSLIAVMQEDANLAKYVPVS